MPERGTEPSADMRTVTELPSNLDAGMVYRTEMRHLWQQGEGWLGMKEFAYDHAGELNAISPELAEKYQELDRLYRYGQLAQLGLMPIADVVDRLPRELISSGREVVTSDFEIVEAADGSKSVAVRSVKGIAVGRNGWAAAHEARKAAAQMATPNEGAYRWLMSSPRRERLNQATNSNRAEIRQGVFGPQVVEAMRERLGILMHSKQAPLSEQQYLDIVDGIFSMHPGVFQRAMSLLFNSDFQKNSSIRGELRALLDENGVIRK
ncbi:MAG: hypothetical protein HY537_08155 [Deltaproteobacteria bacterium]|nr:hypothetical protein [Deltaproteobacteria bacterium]